MLTIQAAYAIAAREYQTGLAACIEVFPVNESFRAGGEQVLGWIFTELHHTPAGVSGAIRGLLRNPALDGPLEKSGYRSEEDRFGIAVRNGVLAQALRAGLARLETA